VGGRIEGIEIAEAGIEGKASKSKLKLEPGQSSIAEVKVRGILRRQLVPVVRNLWQAGSAGDSQSKAFGLDFLLGAMWWHDIGSQ
jgi:hypothetical protein